MAESIGSDVGLRLALRWCGQTAVFVKKENPDDSRFQNLNLPNPGVAERLSISGQHAI